MQGDAIAQARRHGALVVIEEIRSLGAEPEKISVRLQELIRLLPESAAERILRKKEMGEVGRHEQKIP